MTAINDKAYQEKDRGRDCRRKNSLEKGLMALGIDYIPSTANYYLIRLDQAL